MKPYEHAENSAKEFGGVTEDYLDIHRLMDSSKEVLADNRHRALTHHTWFIEKILPLVFGDKIVNSDGDHIWVTDVGQQHVLEDFGDFIPTAQDYLNDVKYELWTNGVSKPDSQSKMDLLSIARSIQDPHKHVVSN